MSCRRTATIRLPTSESIQYTANDVLPPCSARFVTVANALERGMLDLAAGG